MSRADQQGVDLTCLSARAGSTEHVQLVVPRASQPHLRAIHHRTGSQPPRTRHSSPSTIAVGITLNAARIVAASRWTGADRVSGFPSAAAVRVAGDGCCAGWRSNWRGIAVVLIAGIAFGRGPGSRLVTAVGKASPREFAQSFPARCLVPGSSCSVWVNSSHYGFWVRSTGQFSGVALPRRTTALPASPEFLVERSGAIVAALQPVIDLHSDAVVGYEALARVAPGYPPLTPAQMFAWARRCHRVGELDWACRGAAFRSAIGQHLDASTALLVNVEPAALDTAAPQELLGDLQLARRQLRVVIELTERDLTSNPVQLFRVVDSMRALGWEIALDDVGAEPASLALLPLLQPDVIKLDRSVIVDPDQPHHARTAVAVAAEAERTGATVIAEGIETPEQLEVAKSMGARYGQGFMLGRPTTLVRTDLARSQLPRRTPVPSPRAAGVVRSTVGHEMSTAEIGRLIRRLLSAAATDTTAAVLAGWPAVATADIWRADFARLASCCAFIGLSTTTDHSCHLVILGPNAAAALSAFPSGHDVWDVFVTYRLDAVIAEGQRLCRTVMATGAVLSRPLLPGDLASPQEHAVRSMHYA